MQLVAPASADFAPVAVQADLHAVDPTDASRASPALPPQRVGLKDSDHWVSACASGKPNRAAVGTGGLAQARPMSLSRLTCRALRPFAGQEKLPPCCARPVAAAQAPKQMRPLGECPCFGKAQARRFRHGGLALRACACKQCT